VCDEADLGVTFTSDGRPELHANWDRLDKVTLSRKSGVVASSDILRTAILETYRFFKDMQDRLVDADRATWKAEYSKSDAFFRTGIRRGTTTYDECGRHFAALTFVGNVRNARRRSERDKTAFGDIFDLELTPAERLSEPAEKLATAGSTLWALRPRPFSDAASLRHRIMASEAARSSWVVLVDTAYWEWIVAGRAQQSGSRRRKRAPKKGTNAEHVVRLLRERSRWDAREPEERSKLKRLIAERPNSKTIELDARKSAAIVVVFEGALTKLPAALRHSGPHALCENSEAGYLWQSWHQRVGARPLFQGTDELLMEVAAPVSSADEAEQLAVEHICYAGRWPDTLQAAFDQVATARVWRFRWG
jgi:hypothetical protein